MICLISNVTDPFFNLAMEEYLLLHEERDIFMLWQSLPAVVVGKHQNALAEVNLRYVRENNILLARRLSGGGTVFHGPGNLNFTFIAHGETGKLVDFGRFIMPVIRFLDSVGVVAERGHKNEILVDGKKVSGNAEHVHKNRVLHHGTLLFQTDLSMLQDSIRAIPGRYTDKAVQSNRSTVTNLAGFLPGSVNLEIFKNQLFQFILHHEDGEIFQPGESTLAAVQELAGLKYRSWDWVYGWSPDYEFRGEAEYPEGTVNIHLKVHRGIIVDCSLVSPGMQENDLFRIRNRLMGSRHDPDLLMELFSKYDFAGCQSEACRRDLVYGFF
jgi:lipoate---protein ligase